MSPQNHSPASVRYLKARLWNLARPSFWGTAIFLSVIGLLIRQYWINPNFFSTVRTENPESTQPLEFFLSEEDKAIAADIDNLPVLFYESKQKNLSDKVIKLKQQIKAVKKQAASENQARRQNNARNQIKLNYEAITKQNRLNSKVKNPFLQQANKLLEFKDSFDGGQFTQNQYPNSGSSGRLKTTSYSGAFTTTPNYSPQYPAGINALQIAIEELENKNKQQLQIQSGSQLQTNVAVPVVPSYNSSNLNRNTNNSNFSGNFPNPVRINTHLKSPYINSVQSSPQSFVNTSGQVNPQTNIRSFSSNPYENNYSSPYKNYVNNSQQTNMNSIRQLNRPVVPEVNNVTPGNSVNIRPNTTRFYSVPNPRQNIVTPNNLTTPNNLKNSNTYNQNLRSYNRQPSNITNYNNSTYSTSPQVPSQTNGYSYP
ncbi:ATP synthase subunit B family protein [Mastigocoleus testarum]|uniref:Uncharacterized protein n=1 Tax=Mastigocoleus testarum BC008 TaxID=371196 RepID=A0A0V7ZC90_9CYAN|nr:hypothetical protein [Mastigocoleus testarum]KST62126.1 hypothetical protein BC008_37380 [Mastigocoleus testarum BC008]